MATQLLHAANSRNPTFIRPSVPAGGGVYEVSSLSLGGGNGFGRGGGAAFAGGGAGAAAGGYGVYFAPGSIVVQGSLIQQAQLQDAMVRAVSEANRSGRMI